MSEKHEEGRGTSPSAFTPVGGVGFPIEAARDAHSGYNNQSCSFSNLLRNRVVRY